MSTQTITIQGIPFTIDPADDGLLITVGAAIGATSGEAACAMILVEVDSHGNVNALLWDDQAEAGSAEDNSIEPVRIPLLHATKTACFRPAILLPTG
jgi:hypothetical protein